VTIPSSLPARPARRYAHFALFAGVAALGLWLAAEHPVLYFWDPYERIAHRDEMIVRRWLPGLQALVWLWGKLSSDVATLRALVVLVSAGAAASVFAYARRLGSDTGAFVGALLFASNRMFLETATVPYQESLFVLALLAGLALRDRSRAWAAVCTSLACLTRYEAWLAVGSFALFEAIDARKQGFAALRRVALDFLRDGGVVMLAWLLLGSFELSEQESSLERRSDAAYFVEMSRSFAGFLWRHGGPVILVAGAWGWARALFARPRVAAARPLALFLALDVAMILAVDPFSGSRRVFVAILLLALFAGHGLVDLATRVLGVFAKRSVPQAGAATLLAVLALEVPPSVRRGIADVERASSQPALVAAREAGLWLATEPPSDAPVVAFVAEDVQELALETWSARDVKLARPGDAIDPNAVIVIELLEADAVVDGEIQRLRATHDVTPVDWPWSSVPRAWRVTRR
jgi:hypothetical protein